MIAKELRQKTTAELAEEGLQLRREQFNLRMQQATGQLARSDQYRRVRKDIARVKTVMSEQEKSQQKIEAGS